MADSPGLSFDDRQAITDVILRFYWLVDHGRAAETAALFTATGKITFGPGSPKPGVVEGAAIPPAMKARAEQTHVTTRHVLSNVALTARPDGTVESYSLLTLFRSDTQTLDSLPASVADINETFVRDKGVWRIQERTITPIFNRR